MTTTQTFAAPFGELSRAFHGSIILPDDPRWDNERILWNPCSTGSPW